MFDQKTIDKFWSGVQKGDGCWVYLPRYRGQRSRATYRAFWADGIGAIPSHKMAYELTYGPLQPGHLVRHRCAFRPCCRPDHLLGGTPEENMWDIQVRLLMNIGAGELATYEDFPEWKPARLR